MKIISEKAYNEKASFKSVTNFYNHYRLGPALKTSNLYKQKGIPAASIITYLISLIYTGKSMFEDMRGNIPMANGFGKDSVYRFLNMANANWQALLLTIGSGITAELDKLTSCERRSAFVIDDTIFSVPYAKKTELVSKIFDHADKGSKFKWGFRLLTLGWTDGSSFIPLAYRHLASSDEDKRRNKCNVCYDKRSLAYRIRNEAVSKATDVMNILLKSALKSGVSAKYVLFDTWFAYPTTMIKVSALGIHVVARVKDTTKIKYLVGGEKKTAKEIFKANRKRRGRSRYLLSVEVTLCSAENGETLPARLVYIRNRNKRNDWVALVCTDPGLKEEEAISLYGKRWDIEVFFKICKSYLKLTREFQQLSYDALTAHTAIVMIRYMILSVEKRKGEDPRSLGELFFLCYDEADDIRFEQALLFIMLILTETLKEESIGLSEAQKDMIMDSFIEKLPEYIRTCLQPCIES